MSQDARLYAPAVARNREPILEVLWHHLPSRGLVLEVASGWGEHVAHFAKVSAPDLIFQPSDPDPGARASMDAWTAALGLRNVRPAIALDGKPLVRRRSDFHDLCASRPPSGGARGPISVHQTRSCRRAIA